MSTSGFRSVAMVMVLLALSMLASTVAVSAVQPVPLSAPSLVPHYSIRADLRDTTFEVGPTAYSPIHDRLYIAYIDTTYIQGSSKTLAVFDTRLGKHVRTWYGPQLTEIALSRDEATLYAYSPISQTVKRFDAATLAVLGEFPLSCPDGVTACEVGEMEEGPDGRLYWIGVPTELIGVSDGLTGEVLGSAQHPDGTEIRELTLYEDVLYVQEVDKFANNPAVSRYNIAEPTPVLETVAPTDFFPRGLEAARDGSFLLAGETGELRILDPSTLAVTGTIPNSGVPWPDRAVIALDSDSVSAIDTSEGHDDFYRIGTFGIQSGEPFGTFGVRTDDVSDPHLNTLVALDNGELALIFYSRVLILRPSDHASGIPMAFANYCGGGRFTDSFSDPASGWPVGDTGRVAFGYDRSQYFLLQRDADRWSAVTRGDVWIEGRHLEVRTWQPAREGISGLVFGIRSDWSRFMTFEVIPELRRWVVFRFDQDAGWDLLASAQSSLIRPVGSSNTLSIEQINGRQVAFMINDLPFWVLNAMPDGRVGLSAGSFEEDVDTRFDDYVFSGQNCPLDARQEMWVPAPVLSRPPLSTFGIDDR